MPTAQRIQMAASATSQSPAAIAGMMVWFEADAITGLNDGDAVSTWPDSSSNGSDLTQSTGSNKPVYKTGIVNGRPVVRFDGTDDKMATEALTQAQPITSFVVARTNAPAGGSHHTLWSNGSGGIQHYLTLTDGFHSMWGGSALTGTTDRTQGWHVFEAVYNGASSVGAIDGITDPAVGNVGAGDFSASALQVGTNNASFLGGDVAEVILYDSELSADDREAVRGYLLLKYGIASWSPAHVASLQAWYDFSDATALYTDTARTTVVTADGDAIRGVRDKSGKGHHLATTANPPAYKVAIKNSRSVARFDDVNDELVTAAFGADLAQPNTVVVVASTANFASGAGAFFLDGIDAQRVLLYSYLSNFYYEAGSGVSLGASDANFHILAATFAGASSKGWKDGGAAVAGDAGTRAIHGLTVGNSFVFASPLNGDVAHVLVYNAAVSLADLNRLGVLLGSQYAMTWTTAT